MEPEAQVEAAPESQVPAEPEEVTPESFNIFSEEPAPQLTPQEPGATEPRKSKQFLENLKRDRNLRQNEIALKQKAEHIAQREAQLSSVKTAQDNFRNNPDEFFRSQGIDPMTYYREWTERLVNSDGKPSLETQLDHTNEELSKIKEGLSQKEHAQRQAQENNHRQAAYSDLCQKVERYAVDNEGYETIKDSCTASDIVNGMVAHFQQSGEELTIEEAFEKIETGLREREESFYKDPKIVEKLRRYNPEAMRTARGPQATLSARFKEQPTRTDPDDMSHDEIREYWKGKLFT